MNRFVGAAGRRLTRLQRLTLTGARRLQEAALEHLSGKQHACMRMLWDCRMPLMRSAMPVPASVHAGLTQLTGLTLGDAHDFGGRALEALRPLARLRRLALSETSISPGGLGCFLDGDDLHPLLPALTFLALQNCRLLRCGGRRQPCGAAVVHAL